MSRIGLQPVIVLSGTEVQISPGQVEVKGPKGEMKLALPSAVEIKQINGRLLVNDRSGNNPAIHGTIRSLLNNLVVGVSDGFEKKLELFGLGYRANLEDKKLVLQVGFTHPVGLEIPEGIEVRVEKNTVTIAGCDKQAVGQFAAEVRSVKKPEPYKGKGIRYQGEQIKLKEGKAAKPSG